MKATKMQGLVPFLLELKESCNDKLFLTNEPN